MPDSQLPSPAPDREPGSPQQAADPAGRAEPTAGPRPDDVPTQPEASIHPLSDSGLDGMRLTPLIPRREHPHLLVEMDGSPGSHGALVWALREAARREATVVALAVLDSPDGDPLGGGTRVNARAYAAAHDRVEAQLLRAIAETGVHGRSRCAVLDRAVLDALTAAGRGGDLVVVGARGKTLLRHAVPRPIPRRLARGA